MINNIDISAQLIDNVTFMLYDLELGGFISNPSSFFVDAYYSIEYKRETVSEDKTSKDQITVVSNFYVTVKYKSNDILNFLVDGEKQHISVINFLQEQSLEFIDILQEYRESKFFH